MRQMLALAAMLAIAFVVMTDANYAQDKKKTDNKEVVLKGKIACAKCELGEGTDCATVIVVTKDKKDTVYFFDAAAHKKYHGEICSSAKNGTVVGTVTEADKKKTVTVKKVEFAQ